MISTLFLYIALAANAQDRRPITLPEAYDRALKTSETLLENEAAVAEAQARVSELLATVQPTVDFKASQFYQDDSNNAGGAVSTFNRTYRPEAKISAHQPLFSGFREYMGYKSAKASARAGEHSLEAARKLLYADVVAAYTGLLGVRQELGIRSAVRDLTADRVKELKERAKLGRSRQSEVLAAESQLANAEADLETAAGRERDAQEVLRFLTGSDSDLEPAPVDLPALEPVDPLLAAARARPDVEAARLQADAADLAVAVYSREHWPVIAADGNYYLKRTGFQEDIKWDATLSLDLPLYAGGATVARTRGAKARKRAAEQAYRLAGRRAESDVRARYYDVDSALKRAAALDKAASLADANVKAQREDYRNGLVTNLDVLGALNALQQTRLQLDRARLDAVLYKAELDVAAGGPKP